MPIWLLVLTQESRHSLEIGTRRIVRLRVVRWLAHAPQLEGTGRGQAASVGASAPDFARPLTEGDRAAPGG